MTNLLSHNFESPLAFGEKLTPFVSAKIDAMDLRFNEIVVDYERDQWLRTIVREVVDGQAPVAGAHRQEQWENGWAEHRAMLEKDPSWRSLVPRYFGKHPVVRWQRRLIKPASLHFEYHMLEAVQFWLFDKYLRDADAIYELGCGTGHAMLRVRSVNPDAAIVGFDWARASQDLIAGSDLFDVNMAGSWLNFFNPEAHEDFPVRPAAAFYSCAALEQIGRDWGMLLNWLLAQKPSIVVHIEPLTELLDGDNLLDYLSLQYSHKRGYLRNYLTILRDLETQGRVKIHMVRRTGVGSIFLDGYQALVWSPT